VLSQLYGVDQWFSNCVPREILRYAAELFGFFENNQLVLQLGMHARFECTLNPLDN